MRPPSRTACRSSDRDAASYSAPVVTAVPGSASNGVPVSEKDEQVKTRFIAETLLPTKHGKFRLRGYKHSVRVFSSRRSVLLQPLIGLCGSRWTGASPLRNPLPSSVAMWRARAT